MTSLRCTQEHRAPSNAKLPASTMRTSRHSLCSRCACLSAYCIRGIAMATYPHVECRFSGGHMPCVWGWWAHA